MKPPEGGATFARVQAIQTFLARRAGPLSVDGIIAAGLLVVAQLELALSNHIEGPPWVNAVAAAGVTLPVAWRRTFPLYVAPLILAFLIWQETLDGDVVENSVAAIVTVPLAMYSLGVLLDRRRAMIGFGVSLALAWILVSVSMDRSLEDFVTTLVFTGGPFLFGRIVNALVAPSHVLRERAARLEREDAESAKLALAE